MVHIDDSCCALALCNVSACGGRVIGHPQTPRIIDSCPLTELNGDLRRPHTTDEAAVNWLTSRLSGAA